MLLAAALAVLALELVSHYRLTPTWEEWHANARLR